MIASEELLCPFGDSWEHCLPPGEDPEAPGVPGRGACPFPVGCRVLSGPAGRDPLCICVCTSVSARLLSQREERQKQAKNYELAHFFSVSLKHVTWLVSPEVFRETMCCMKETTATKNKIYEFCHQELNSHRVVFIFFVTWAISHPGRPPIPSMATRNPLCCTAVRGSRRLWKLLLSPYLREQGQAWVHNDYPSGGALGDHQSPLI